MPRAAMPQLRSGERVVPRTPAHRRRRRQTASAEQPYVHPAASFVPRAASALRTLQRARHGTRPHRAASRSVRAVLGSDQLAVALLPVSRHQDARRTAGRPLGDPPRNRMGMAPVSDPGSSGAGLSYPGAPVAAVRPAAPRAGTDVPAWRSGRNTRVLCANATYFPRADDRGEQKNTGRPRRDAFAPGFFRVKDWARGRVWF